MVAPPKSAIHVNDVSRLFLRSSDQRSKPSFQTYHPHVVNPAKGTFRTVLIGPMLATFVCLLSLQASCTSETPSSTTAKPETIETQSSILEGVEIVETIPPTAEGDEPEPLNQDGPRRGGVLAAPAFSCSIADPAIDGAAEAMWIDDPSIVTEIHAGLFKLSDDPHQLVTLELVSSYEVREQGLLYEFVLRSDLKFSDGSPLTASDLKWSWERALRKSIPGGRARDVLGQIEGAQAVTEGKSHDLVGVTVVDDRTIEVRLTRARAEFAALLADPVASVLKKDNVETWAVEWENPGGYIEVVGFDETNMPVGAGPFKLVTYRVSFATGKDRCAIARNPHYWGRPAYLDGVWFRNDVVKNETHAQHGEINTIDPLAFANEGTDHEATGCSVDETGSRDFIEVADAVENSADQAPTISFIVLNAAAPPFDDLHFRRAVVASANVDSVRWRTDTERRLISGDLTTLELPDVHPIFDLETARTEYAKSKYQEQSEAWELGYLPSDSWGLLFDLDVLFQTWSEMLNMVVEEEIGGHSVIDDFEGRYNSDYHLRMYHEIPTFPDPSTVLRAIIAPFGEIGNAPEFLKVEEMLGIAATEQDAVKRHQMYLDIEAYLAEEALVIPIEVFAGFGCYRTHPWVNGLEPPKYLGSIFYDVWLNHRAPQRELPIQ